jgi:D-threo-aldose 1-dehydrogenase
MRSASRRQRQRVLGEAFERGITHFDVARMYGLGAAEGELGRFAAHRRDEVTIATKFGIDPAGPASRLARFQGPARAAIARVPALRAAIKRRQGSLHQSRDYDGAVARASLETSLRALGTDYVDVLFLHDPQPGDRVDVEGLAETLEELRVAGRIRAWGLSGDPAACLPLGDAFAAPVTMQLRDEILDSAPARAEWGPAPITFGVLSRALGRVLGYVTSSEERRRRWTREVGVDCGQPDVVASLLLQDALDRNREGMVLYSTSRPERIGAAVEAAERLAGGAATDAVLAFRERVLIDLGSRRGHG